MPYLIGTDEAGYGPNLGPLVVTATVWEIDDGIECANLYRQLRKFIVKSVEKATKNRIVWADSKVVYKNGDGLDHLERGVLAALAMLDQLPDEWSALWRRLDPVCEARLSDLPWHSGYSTSVPMWLESDGLLDLAIRLRDGMHSAGVRLKGIISRGVFPDEFNRLCVECANKADALSRITLGLVVEALKLIDDQPVHVYCDKHGGRNRYHELLQSQFPDDWIEVRVESAAESSYRFGPEERRVEVGFWVEGERFLPVALASMVSKYLRETAMRPFNQFWCQRMPGLRPRPAIRSIHTVSKNRLPRYSANWRSTTLFCGASGNLNFLAFVPRSSAPFHAPLHCASCLGRRARRFALAR